MKAPLLVQIDLLGSADQPVAGRWLPMLSELARIERPLVLVDARPDRWAPTRNRVDRAFSRQATIEADLRRAGGLLDAVLYLDLGLFGRKRQFELNLADLANRYNTRLEEMTLIAPAGRIADALGGLVGTLVTADNADAFADALRDAAQTES